MEAVRAPFWRRGQAWIALWVALWLLLVICFPADRNRPQGSFIVNSVPFTPASFELLVAASRGDVERIRELAGQLEPLHAVFSNNEIIAFGLQDRLPEFGTVPSEGQTPIHLAAQAGHFEGVRTLLELGASPNLVPPGGWPPPLTPLALAAGRNDERMVRLLLDWGARVVVAARPDWIKYAPKTVIVDARGRSQVASIESLLEAASDFQQAEDAMRDAQARKDTKVPNGWSPARAEAGRDWSEASQRWREATRNGTRPAPEVIGAVERAVWLDPDSGAIAPAASIWALEALARGEASRSEWILRRYVLHHPIEWYDSDGLGFFLIHCRAFAGGSGLWERIKARRAEEDAVMHSRYRHHPTAIAFAKLHEQYRKRNRNAMVVRVLGLGAAAGAVVALASQIGKSGKGRRDNRPE